MILVVVKNTPLACTNVVKRGLTYSYLMNQQTILDLETTKWLEDYLKYFKGAIVIISHDRYFLDKIVTQIYDVT